MKIYIRDRNPSIIEEFHTKGYTDLPDLKIDAEIGSPLDLEVEAVVSPANSFGFMNGGIDAAYIQFFGPELQQRVFKVVREQPFGEILVGDSRIVPTYHSKIPKLIVAPTMRVPQRLHDATNVYLAARAAVKAGWPWLETITFPGMGTGIGGLNSETAVRAMVAGFEDAFNYFRNRMKNVSAFPSTWREVSEQQDRINGTERLTSTIRKIV